MDLYAPLSNRLWSVNLNGKWKIELFPTWTLITAGFQNLWRSNLGKKYPKTGFHKQALNQIYIFF